MFYNSEEIERRAAASRGEALSQGLDGRMFIRG